MTLKHGTYAVAVDSIATSAIKSNTTLVVVGTAEAESGKEYPYAFKCSTLEEFATEFPASVTANNDFCKNARFVLTGQNHVADVVFVAYGDDDFADVDSVLQELYRNDGTIPSIVYSVAGYECGEVANMWHPINFLQLPESENKTIAQIKTLKASYTNDNRNVYFAGTIDGIPMALHFAKMQCVVDGRNGGIPFEGASNKVAEGVAIKPMNFTREEGNSLNEAGINTAIAFDGNIRLWGNYGSLFGSASVDPADVFYTTRRMLDYIMQRFMLRHALEIDKPMTRALRDSILVAEQAELDRLVAIGALVGSPKVAFREEDNPVGEMVQGNFVWTIEATPSAPMASATLRVAYTDAGFSVFYE